MSEVLDMFGQPRLGLPQCDDCHRGIHHHDWKIDRQGTLLVYSDGGCPNATPDTGPCECDYQRPPSTASACPCSHCNLPSGHP